MKCPGVPRDEARRLAALRSLQLLDSAPDERFDRIIRLATQLVDVPIALVSLVDERRQWFKARLGLAVSETSRAISFCGHAVEADAPLVVPDAAVDPRFEDNPLVVGEPGIRFYAGVPLHAPTGEAVGTLCVIDRRPRQLEAAKLQALVDLASLVQEELVAQDAAWAVRALDQQRRLFAELSAAAPIGIFHTDPSGRCDYTNERWQEITGLDAEQALGNGWATAIHPDDRARVFAAWSAAAAGGTEFHETFRFRRPSGEMRWVSARARRIVDDKGVVTGWVGTDEDITAQREVEARRREAEDLFGQLAAVIDDVFWICTADLKSVLYVSPAYAAIWGRSVEALYRQPRDWMEAVHPDDRARVSEALTRAVAGGVAFDVEYRIHRPDGELRVLHDRGFVVRDEEGAPSRLVGVASDVTREHTAKLELERQATVDPLTGLLNQREFRRRLTHELERSRRLSTPLCLAMIDLDHFKAVNDSHGHAAGDLALTHVAAVLRTRLRQVDLVGRYGGDEFCAILLGATEAQAVRAMDAVGRLVARKPLRLPNGTEVPLSLSIGVVELSPADLSDGEARALFAAADEALYSAKRQGRNRVVGAGKDAPAGPPRARRMIEPRPKGPARQPARG